MVTNQTKLFAMQLW